MRLYKTHQWFREHRLPVRIIICKARRAGLSTGVEALIYDDTVMNPNTKSIIVANQKNPSENVLAMCTLFWRHTPAFFEIGGQRIAVRPQLPPQFNNNPPKDRLEFADPLNSKIFVATARSLDAYLGYGFQNCHATEAGYYVDGAGLFRALYPTISREPHSSLYIESTPNGQEGPGAWFYSQCMDAASRKKTEYGEMRLVFIPWHEMTKSFAIPFKDDAERVAFGKGLNQAEKDLIRQLPHLSMEQLRWRRMMLAGPVFNQDEDLFDQEFPSDLATCFLVSGVSVFRRKDIKRLAANTRDPIWEGDVYWGGSPESHRREPMHDLVRRPELLDKWQAKDAGWESHVNERTYENLKIFRYPKPGERLFIAADVGKGNPETKDGDYSVMHVGVLNELDRDEIIMTWRGHLNPLVYAELASALCWWLAYRVGDKVQMPELIPEWTGPGGPMCSYIDQKSLYPHLYRYEDFMKVGSKKTNTLGWESNGKTKPFAVSCMTRMVERDMIDIPDTEIVREMSSYRELNSFNDEGSFGGAAGRHDDHVSALSILCALLRRRSSPIPGEEDAIEIDNEGGGEDLMPFSPWDEEDVNVLPGLTDRDVDDEGIEAGWNW